jgi:hypothetical protein
MKLDENTALAIIFSNIRRKKRNEDIITIAESFKYLEDLYGSKNAVADKVGLSAEMVRQFLTALKLPKEVQKLIRERKIDSVDKVKEIYSLKEESKQIKAAKELASSKTKDFRDIKRLAKVGDFSINEAMEILSKTKPKGMHFFIMDFDDETYDSLLKNAKAVNSTPAELVKEIVTEWLKNNPITKK